VALGVLIYASLNVFCQAENILGHKRSSFLLYSLFFKIKVRAFVALKHFLLSRAY
jgi:hypothetical protein